MDQSGQSMLYPVFMRQILHYVIHEVLLILGRVGMHCEVHWRAAFSAPGPRVTWPAYQPKHSLLWTVSLAAHSNYLFFTSFLFSSLLFLLLAPPIGEARKRCEKGSEDGGIGKTLIQMSVRSHVCNAVWRVTLWNLSRFQPPENLSTHAANLREATHPSTVPPMGYLLRGVIKQETECLGREAASCVLGKMAVKGGELGGTGGGMHSTTSCRNFSHSSASSDTQCRSPLLDCDPI